MFYNLVIDYRTYRISDKTLKCFSKLFMMVNSKKNSSECGRVLYDIENKKFKLDLDHDHLEKSLAYIRGNKNVELPPENSLTLRSLGFSPELLSDSSENIKESPVYSFARNGSSDIFNKLNSIKSKSNLTDSIGITQSSNSYIRPRRSNVIS